MNTNMRKKIAQARTSLLLEHPFFGALALRLNLTESAEVDTAATDGTHLFYNPANLAGKSNRYLMGLVAEEVMHCTNGHVWRRNGRDAREWNEACDYALSDILVKAGLVQPDEMLYDKSFAGMSAEAIFAKRRMQGNQPDPINPKPKRGEVIDPKAKPGNDKAKGNDGKPGDKGKPGPAGKDKGKPGKPGANGEPDPNQDGQDGEGTGPDADGIRQMTEADWQQITIVEAKRAQQRGNLPAGIDRQLGVIRQPDCRSMISALREFVGRSAKDDYSWRKPNTRYIPHGLYMPSLYSDAMPPVAIAVDTSGSISPDILAEYTKAMQVTLDECRPEKMTVLSCDTKVHSSVEYAPGDDIATDAKSYKGGGGTDFRPVFKAIDESGEEPCCAVYLTDLEGTFPDRAPDYPVLWIVRDVYGKRERAPFGETIWIS